MLNNIQILRALAALAVVMFHVIGISKVYGLSTSLVRIEGWGDCGVDVFFVISGFVMVYTQDRKHRTASEFFKERLLRIVPIYWLLTFAMIALLFVVPAAFRDDDRGLLHIVSSLLFVAGVALDRMPVLYVGWSLEYELLFYTLFAVGLIFTRRRYAFLFPILALIVAVLLGWSRPIALEFACGMMVAKAYQSGRFRIGLPLAMVGAALLCVTMVWRPDIDRLLLSGVPAVLLVYGALHMRQLASKWLVYLGGASYSIYLVQVFTIPAFYKFSSRYLDAVPVDLLAAAAFVSTAVFGCLVYRYVELPMTARLKKMAAGDGVLAVKT
ncbi:acyltransferase [Cupriavidus sp. DL-D2]|uniref:acyltransferase family protein n=1 Tax=Cupriavidus sp. DL-D2 TaxID=3144974 RepID=UPI003211FD93